MHWHAYQWLSLTQVSGNSRFFFITEIVACRRWTTRVAQFRFMIIGATARKCIPQGKLGSRYRPTSVHSSFCMSLEPISFPLFSYFHGPRTLVYICCWLYSVYVSHSSTPTAHSSTLIVHCRVSRVVSMDPGQHPHLMCQSSLDATMAN